MAAGTKKRPIEALAIAVQIAMLAAAPTRTEYTGTTTVSEAMTTGANTSHQRTPDGSDAVPKTSATAPASARIARPKARRDASGGRRPSPRLAAPVTLPPAVGAQAAGVRLKSDT